MSEMFENQFYNKNMSVHSGVVCMVKPGAPLAEVVKGVQSKNFKKVDYIQYIVYTAETNDIGSDKVEDKNIDIADS